MRSSFHCFSFRLLIHLPASPFLPVCTWETPWILRTSSGWIWAMLGPRSCQDELKVRELELLDGRTPTVACPARYDLDPVNCRITHFYTLSNVRASFPANVSFSAAVLSALPRGGFCSHVPQRSPHPGPLSQQC